MSLGGINNPALIGASQREARSKLDVMAGIKRPQGIMASSPQLMQAAMPAAAMPAAPMPMPPAPMPPVPMPPVQPTLPQMPMNTAVAPMVPAPRSLNPMAPAVPTVPQPASPTTPMNFQEAGPVAVNPQFEGYSKMGAEIGDSARASVAAGGSSTVDITMDATSFMKKLLGELPGDIQQNLLDQHGDPAGVEKAVSTTATNIEDALETEDPAKVSAAALKALDVPDTEEARLDVANTFGFDTSNIAALDDKIMEVLMAGRATDFQQAVLVGLQNYKSTAMARAAASVGTTKGYTTERLFQQAVQEIMSNPGQYDVYGEGPEGLVDPQKVRQQAMQIANVTAQAMGGQPAAPPSQTLLQQVQEAIKLEPKRRKEILKQATDAGIDVKGL